MDVKNIIVEQLPPIYSLPDGSVLGTGSLYLHAERVRLIEQNHFFDVGAYSGTQQVITRGWLNDTVKKRIAKTAEVRGVDFARAPMYAESAILPDAEYIDIQSAYHSIYSALGWGVDYVRHAYMAGGSDRLVYPFQNLKVGRSLVISGSLPRSRIIRVKDHKPVVQKLFNPMSNPSLVAGTLDVLSAIARFAVSAFGAIYYNVDGAIVPRDTAKLYKEFLSSLGLGYGSKGDGRAWVSNLTNWSLGEKVVRRGSEGKLGTGDWIPLPDSSAEWVLERFIEVQRWRGVT